MKESTVERGALSVAEFCLAHNISRSSLYKEWDLGRGPRIMKVGNRRLISVEAAAEWRRQREEDAEAAGGADTPTRRRRAGG